VKSHRGTQFRIVHARLDCQARRFSALERTRHSHPCRSNQS
jgi:hypothetical protein